jgi:hypothetical protein
MSELPTILTDTRPNVSRAIDERLPSADELIGLFTNEIVDSLKDKPVSPVASEKTHSRRLS